MKQLIIKTIAFAILTTFISCSGEQKENTENNANKPKSMLEETTPSNMTKEQKMEMGKIAYAKVCQACHQANGNGIPNTFPPLVKSDYLAKDLKKSIEGVVNGLSGEIEVNGVKYNQTMPKADLTDEEIAAVFTYVLNEFDNEGGEISAADVKALRK